MRLEFDSIAHKYTVDGRPLHSVTEILRAANLYERYAFAREIHRFRGTAVHHACSMIDKGADPYVTYSGDDPEIVQAAMEINEGYLPAFRAFKSRTGFFGRCHECYLIDPLAGYGGTFDMVGTFAGKPEVVLLEIKSGSMPPLVPVQLAAYVELIAKGQPVHADHPGWQWVQEGVRSGVPVRRIAVRLEKTGTYTVFSETAKGDSYDSPMWTSAFRSALNLVNVQTKYGILKGTE